MIKLGIAEDKDLVRWALREALRKETEIEVVGDAGTAAGTLEMIQQASPDVLLLDFRLPDLSGIELLKRINESLAPPVVIWLVDYTEPSYAARAFAVGLQGLVNKYVSRADLLSAIRAVSRGEHVIPPAVERFLAKGNGHPTSALSPREEQVLEMIASGNTREEISTKLNITIKTHDTHRAHVLEKLNLKNNVQITRFAIKHGYVTL